MRVVYAGIISLIVLLFSCIQHASASDAIETYQNQLQGRIKKGDTLIVKDEKFMNSTYDWSKIHNRTVNNLITFGLYRDSGVVFKQSFKCEIDVKVEYWSQPDQTDPVISDHIKLNIDYDTTAGVSYQEASSYRFLNGYKVKITVNDIVSAELGSKLPAGFRLNSQIFVERSYEVENKVVPNVFFSQGNGNKNSAARTIDVTQDKVKLIWENTASEYDLEWTFIDEESDNGHILETAGTSITDAQLKAMFRNNSTRVTVQNNEYEISLINSSKYLLIRMRNVSNDANGFRNEGDWSYDLTENGTTVKGVITLGTTWHLPDYNWQYSAVYAEDGKKKEIVSYFDGSLRSRQTVTVNNSDKKAIVQESVYDEFGRPLAAILPAPLMQNALTYYPRLHLNNNNSVYNYTDILGTTTDCISTPQPLSTASGASKYYSVANEFLSDTVLNPQHKYIPDAGGYPFAVTLYTADNTNRPRIQGGVGALFQPGPDSISKATRYFYAKPQQWELDRMFGNDVGFEKHYLKNMVIDGNGQVTVSYQNASGKTIATALAGKVPSNLDSLVSKPAAKSETFLILQPDDFTFDASRLKLSANTTYTSAVPSTVQLRYNVGKLIKTYQNGGVKICSNCTYKLLIRVTDNCNHVLYNDTSNVGSLTSNCNNNGAAVDSVKLDFGIGEYYLSMELGLSEEAMNNYTEDYVKRNTNLRSQWDFIRDALYAADNSSCFDDCTTCKAALGAKPDYTNRIIQRLAQNGVDTLANRTSLRAWADSSYNALYNKCLSLRAINCVASPCQELRNTLALDIRPGGQYALFDAKDTALEKGINILYLYWRAEFPAKPTSDSNYIKEQFELNNGLVISPYDSAFTLPMLVKYWKNEWGEKFIKYHPEHCALDFCEATSSYQQWDLKLKQLAETTADMTTITGLTYSRSNSLWLLANDAFFQTGPGQQYRTQFETDLNSYSGNVANIAGLANKGLSPFVDFLLYCSDPIGNTNTATNADKWNNCSPAESCRVPDMEWAMYRDKYLELKQRYYDKLRDNSYCGSSTCPVGTPLAIGVNNPPASVIPAATDFDCVKYSSRSYFSAVPVNRPGASTLLVRCTYSGEPIPSGVSITVPLGAYKAGQNNPNTNVYFDLVFTSGDVVKEIEISPKNNVLADRVQIETEPTCSGVPPQGGCNPLYKFKISRINRISYDLSAIPSDTTSLKAYVAAQMVAQIKANCEAQADSWMQSLATGLAPYTESQKQSLRIKLIQLCSQGGDQEHPNGSSTLPAPNAEQNASFGDVIKTVLGAGAVNMDLNQWLIDAPYPYNTRMQAANRIIQRTDNDICNKLEILRQQYSQQSSTSFYQYLVSTYGAAMNLTEAEFTMLEKGCVNCRFLLAKPVQLPVFLENGAKGCVTPAEFNAGVSSLTQTVPYLSNTHANYETVYTTYLNHRWGFTLSYSDYRSYADSIATYPNRPLCNRPAFTNVKPDPYNCAMEIVDDAVAKGVVLYKEYIAEVRRIFRKDYIAVCSSVQPKLSMTADQQLYHFTLYYYDQAGNLVRTVPPEGVHLLDASLQERIDAARKNSGIICTDNGVTINTSEPVAQNYLTTALQSSGNSAMEFWLYNANGGPTQVVTNTGENKFLMNISIDDQFLNFDVYTLEPSADNTSVNIVQSRHTAADIQVVSPLSPWTHVVLQGNGLNTDSLSVYINGRLCTTVANPAPASFGWDISSTSSGITYTKDLTAVKQLRLYRRLLSNTEIAANASTPCKTLGIDTLTNVLNNWTRFDGTSWGNSGGTQYAEIYPSHTLTTSYAYQSLNGVTSQRSPDHTAKSRFWYDELGRIVFSQNAQQASVSTNQQYVRSYTIYDEQGRITEVGEKSGTDVLQAAPFYTMMNASYWLSLGTNSQITRTYYDEPYPNAGLHQENLRKRVSAITYQDADNVPADQLTYYSYDQIGNVKTLWQRIKALGIKQIDYQYDLVSGKVNKVRYQRGAYDRFFYQYDYDAESRLLAAYTGVDTVGSDGWIIANSKRDAKYSYYLHGPLARTELGNEALVQGIDYAYTLQGWIKGVNGNYLSPGNDIGRDGGPSTSRYSVARDVYSYTLDYYNNDYNAIGDQSSFPLNWQTRAGDSLGRNLFNGNISRSTVTISNIGRSATVGYSYRYDQLNRLRSMRQHPLANGATTWSTLTAGTAYAEDVKYDGNGNILTYKRNGGSTRGTAMDNLRYQYNRDANGYLKDNRLTQVIDDVESDRYDEDISTQGASNYSYDNIGNLIKDVEGGINSVKWSVYGKITTIDKLTGKINYAYDGSGNRVYSYVQRSSNVRDSTWYVRDAQGNTLAVYGTNNGSAKVYWKEQHLYGSSRLGIWQPLIEKGANTSSTVWSQIGKKRYELSNHLGNVLAIISDKAVADGNYYKAELTGAQDYYPFGMLQPDRTFNLGSYRYGFNGKENDNDVKGIGQQQDYGMRVYDPRVGRFLSEDPLTADYPWYTPYQFAGNKPIWATDLDGAEENISTGAFKFIFGSPRSYSNPRTPLEQISNTRLQAQRSAYNSSLLWAPHVAYLSGGGDELYSKHSSWNQLGTNVTMSGKPPSNIVNVNVTASAKQHNERVTNLNKQFHINTNVTGSEQGLVNLLLGSYFKGNAPENIVFPTDGFGSNFLRNSPQVNDALSNYANKGQLSGKAATPSIVSSLYNMTTGGFQLQDFIGSIDYSINTKNGVLTLTMTNVTSLTSGTLGKEALGSSNWPDGIVVGSQKGTNENSNATQTFSLTFNIDEVMKLFKEKQNE